MENNKKLIILTLISYFCVFASFLIVILFHIFRDDYNPIMQTMSEYTIGPFGFLFPIALLILGLSSIISCYTLLKSLPKTQLAKKMLIYFALWTIFIIITGLFPTDYITGPYTFSGITHALASYFAFLFLLICIYYVALLFKKILISRIGYIRFYSYFILCVPGLIFFLIVPIEFKGLTQRIFLGIIIIAYIDIITIPLRIMNSQKSELK